MTEILLVDDDADIRDLVELRLARAGHAITTAGDGVAAVDELLSGTFGLLISDIAMPRMSGLELARWVRAEGPDRHLPILLMTALASAHDREEGFAAGADDYMVKPFSLAQLADRVDRLLRRDTTPTAPGEAPDEHRGARGDHTS